MVVIKQDAGRSNSSRARHRTSANDDVDLDEAYSDALASASSPKFGQRRTLQLMTVVQIVFIFGFLHMASETRNKPARHAVVKEVSDDYLPSHIVEHTNGTLVYFHSPSCSFCQKFATEFEAAAKDLRGIVDTSFVSLSAPSAPLALKRYSITRFPTVMWFRHGQLIRTLSPTVRTSQKIVEFVDWALQTAVINFGSRDEFEEAVPQLRAVLPSGSLPVLVGFGSSPNVQSAMQIVGERFRGDTAFLAVKESRSDDPSIRAYFRNASFDQDYTSILTTDEIQSWVEALMAPKIKKPML
mmetsp:Transcript_2812/g.4350  ORF Transcript_2812/g.4350 Transcript_2812/m.4350 type:complete len:298 (+) Transcript_2812:74-967(+)